MRPPHLWPRSLFGRVAVIVCGGLLVAHALTFWILLREREAAGLSMVGSYVAGDVATAIAILDRLPPEERGAWLPRLARRHYTYAPGAPDAPGAAAPSGGEGPSRRTGTATATATTPALATATAAGRAPPAADPWWRELSEGLAGVLDPGRVGVPVVAPDGRLQVPLRLQDGAWVTLQARPPAAVVSTASTVLLLLQFVALAVAAWGAVRLAVRPLDRLAREADQLVPGQAPARADTEGAPTEVRRALAAFDTLRQRIDAHLAERLQLLAAISHDLQSPLARMALRAEGICDATLREKLQADIAGMQALVEEGLAYARTTHAAREAPRPVDLDALLDAIVCDATDAGHAVTLHGRATGPFVTRVQALRRVVTNLVENAVKFGGGAEVHLVDGAHGVTIHVRDRGPGIPDDQLAAVLLPFHRLEASRSRDTGGTGLGHAIAHALTGALGGRLVLANRAGGGLEASVVLPPPA